MPARKPAKAAQRIAMIRDVQPEPTPEQIEAQEQRRNERILHGGPMRMVVDAVIASGAPVEIETETHIVTITAVPK